jgi:ABC-2 type transport system permease protein
MELSAAVLFGIVPLVGTVLIWQALFESRGEDIRGYNFGQIVYYFLVVLLVDNLVTPTDDEWQIAAEIREGQINNFLSKPVDYLAYRASLFLSARLLYTAVTILPVIAVFAWFHEFIVLPSDPLTWPLFVLSLVMAAALQFLIACPGHASILDSRNFDGRLHSLFLRVLLERAPVSTGRHAGLVAGHLEVPALHL